MYKERLLIFGGAGSLGTHLCENYASYREVHVASRDEAKHWDLKTKFPRDSVHTHICDVRGKERVMEVISRVNPRTIIIAQALKQVDTCEKSPGESVDTNVQGVRNILSAIEKLHHGSGSNIETVLFVSTDKACQPINVYGMCKSISEKLVQSMGDHVPGVKFLTVRYGNVLNSKGSIVPLFMKQAKSPSTKSFTVTHVDMTRFFMTLTESVKLIDNTLSFGKTKEIWVPNLQSFKIIDLAEIFSEKYNKPIEIVGIRPGEKMHEMMISESESFCTESVSDTYFRILPNIINASQKPFALSSDLTLINKELVKEKIAYLLDNRETTQ